MRGSVAFLVTNKAHLSLNRSNRYVMGWVTMNGGGWRR